MPAQTPEAVDALFESGMNAGDAAAVAALYEDDAVLVQAPGQLAESREAILTALQGIVAMKPQFKLNVTSTIIAGNVAVLYNDWTGKFGEAEMSGKAMEICRRQPDGTWKFVIDDPYARG